LGGVPGVDVGLEDLGWAAAARIDPGEELLGLGELLAGEPPNRRGEGPGSDFGAQPGERLSDGELAQEPSVRLAGAVEGGEALVEPGIGVEELLSTAGSTPQAMNRSRRSRR
jgi:hypothetical protein